MRIVLVYLPLVVLTIGFLLGLARLWTAVVFLVAWLVLCELLVVASLVGWINVPPPMGLMVGLLLALPSLWMATACSFATSAHKTPPVAIAADAYDRLNPAQKAQLREAGRVTAKFAAKHLSKHLRDKGYGRSADALQQAGRLI